MKTRLILIACFMMLFVGCEGDDTTVNVPPGSTTGVDDTAKKCPEYKLSEIQCTVTTAGEDNLPTLEPYIVSGRIYKYAIAAIEQCFSYEKTSYLYSKAMESVNKREDAEKVEEWFHEAMRDYVGYEPYETCPGGCGI